MRADTLCGEVGVGLALEISSFVGPCEIARADRLRFIKSITVSGNTSKFQRVKINSLGFTKTELPSPYFHTVLVHYVPYLYTVPYLLFCRNLVWVCAPKCFWKNQLFWNYRNRKELESFLNEMNLFFLLEIGKIPLYAYV